MPIVSIPPTKNGQEQAVDDIYLHISDIVEFPDVFEAMFSIVDQ